MHVLLLNYEFPPAGGGAGSATFQLGRELVKLGVSVDVLTSRIEGEADGADVEGMRVWRVTSWRKGIHDCGMRGAYSFAAFALAKRVTLLRENDYDLEHFFFGLPTGALTLSPWPRSAPPYVLSLRGSDVPGYDEFNRAVTLMHRVLKPASRRIWQKAAAVVALSEDLRDIAAATLPDLEIDVIPNGIESDHFTPAADQDPKPGGALRIVSVARLLERKGIHHLLQAIAKPAPLPVTLTIIGTGSYEQELRSLTERLGLGDRVEFSGFVRRDQLPSHYRAADLFALPSQTESFGLVFAEAMACGLPVLATTVGGIPALVRNGTDGTLVAPANPAALRAALERFIADPDMCRAMGKAARERVVESYSWRSVASQYLSCYEAVLAKGR